jgi:hypothetical protein
LGCIVARAGLVDFIEANAIKFIPTAGTAIFAVTTVWSIGKYIYNCSTYNGKC